MCLAVMCPSVTAVDFGICCMKAARNQFNVTIEDTPWAACGVLPDFDFATDSPLNSVNVSLGWCKENCGGYQPSTTTQWLQPLATWIIPPFTLMLLCSIGEDEFHWLFGSLCYKAVEYINLLGDPASAFCGGFAEIWTDTWLAMKLSKSDQSHTAFEEVRGMVIGVAMLASQTEFENLTFNPLSMLRSPSINQEDKHDADPTSIQVPAEESGSRVSQIRERGDAASKNNTSATFQSRGFEEVEQFAGAIRTVLRARVDFVNGIALPVVLALATTASTFHDAYSQFGDSDTAHGLAFGIWFSWLIILAVVSNSCVASVNPGVAGSDRKSVV